MVHACTQQLTVKRVLYSWIAVCSERGFRLRHKPAVPSSCVRLNIHEMLLPKCAACWSRHGVQAAARREESTIDWADEKRRCTFKSEKVKDTLPCHTSGSRSKRRQYFETSGSSFLHCSKGRWRRILTRTSVPSSERLCFLVGTVPATWLDLTLSCTSIIVLTKSVETEV